jgi:hypothetical protein
MTALFIIRWRGADFGAFTWHDAVKALRNFYPGGEILPA